MFDSRLDKLGFSEAKLDAIGDVVLRHVEEQKIAGGVVLVARSGEVAYHESFGYANVERGAPLKTDSIFRIASMTKPITSVATMILVEDGVISLDDPVSKFIPEFAKPLLLLKSEPVEGQKPSWGMTDASGEITIRHLLTHTAGLSYRFFNHEYLGPKYLELGVSDGLVETGGKALDNAKRIAKAPLLFSPGKDWEYSLSIDVLGAVIEVASGKTLEEFFRTRIFEPLRMNDTHFALPKNKIGRLSVVYAGSADASITPMPKDRPVENGLLVYSQTYPLKSGNQFFSGGAGLVSTTGDYFRFCQMMLQGGELDGRRILKKETVEQMTSNQCGDLDPVLSRVANHGGSFGFGFGVVTEKERGTGLGEPGAFGWGGFFNTYFWVDPERELVAILMTQLHPNGHLKIRDDFRRAVYDSLQYSMLVESP